jgi:ABC-type glutathione transport system ATPase component
MAPLLSVQGLTIRRDDGTGSAIFSNVSFDVEEGDVVIIRGRSGAGAPLPSCARCPGPSASLLTFI